MREAEEEALIGGEPVEHFVLFPLRLEHLVQRAKGDTDSAVVGGVFAEGERAVDVNVVDRDEAAVFVANAVCAFFKLFRVLRCPPIA